MEEEKKGTYVLDAESPVELARLIDLDRMTTDAMGGPLVGIEPFLPHQKVLDVACGPGGWVLDVAFAYPYVDVAGIDISTSMIKYAYTRAHSQGLDNASFGVMDITESLDFSDATFDLVNARFLVGVLKQDVWLPFLTEVSRILKPGGTLRLTEPIELAGYTTSPAYNQIGALMCAGMFRAGYGFYHVADSLGMDLALPALLGQTDFADIHLRSHILNFSEDQSSAWADFKRQLEAGSELATEFLERSGMATKETMVPRYQQALLEMHQTGFRGTWHFFTIYGKKR